MARIQLVSGTVTVPEDRADVRQRLTNAIRSFEPFEEFTDDNGVEQDICVAQVVRILDDIE